MKIQLLLTLFCLSSLVSKAQNLIRNPSFENAIPYEKKTRLWTLSHEIFDLSMKHWTTPTQGTPDIILDEYRGQKGFPRSEWLKNCLPRTGTSIVGLRLFGCSANVTHCREYLQAKTTQTLQPGKCYRYEFYTMPGPNTIKINNISVGLSEHGIKDMATMDILDLETVFPNEVVIDGKEGEWIRVSGEINVDKEFNFFIIGNFESDIYTTFIKPEDSPPDAYYLFDDVMVYEIDCNSKKPMQPIILEKLVMDNVLFAHNSDQLESELKDIYEQIKNTTYSKLIITGHTDSKGTETYNKKLSLRRAIAVMKKLETLGISSEKMEANGMGSKKPIDINDLSLNRRVEIEIIR